MDATERMHSTASGVLSLGCADSGGLHVYIRRYSQNEQQGYYRTSNIVTYSTKSFIVSSSTCNHDNSRTHSSLQVQRTNAVHSAWLTIPKLSEICWQALNHYYPYLKNSSSDKLLHMGIPLKFVRRLDFYDR